MALFFLHASVAMLNVLTQWASHCGGRLKYWHTFKYSRYCHFTSLYIDYLHSYHYSNCSAILLFCSILHFNNKELSLHWVPENRGTAGLEEKLSSLFCVLSFLLSSECSLKISYWGKKKKLFCFVGWKNIFSVSTSFLGQLFLLPSGIIFCLSLSEGVLEGKI